MKIISLSCIFSLAPSSSDALKKERKKVNKSLEYEIRDHGDNYFSPNICQGHLLCMMMIFEKENSETKLEELDEKRLFVQSLCRSFFKHKDLI